MRFVITTLVLIGIALPLAAQQRLEDGPTSEKAQKAYKEGVADLNKGMVSFALDAFRKADKQDGGHCRACEVQVINCAIQSHDWKAGEIAAGELLASAQRPTDVAFAHYEFGALLLNEGDDKHKDDFFTRAHVEMSKALEASPDLSPAVLGDGRALAYLGRDAEATARFEQFAKMVPANSPARQRALRYASSPELVRARMAPPFIVTTLDGQQVSLDALQGKVVLLDFWATWCSECLVAVPHIRQLTNKFKGEPLVVLSISLDTDQKKWKDFIAKNEMTWPQYFDGGWTGPISKLFGVRAIPHTYTIDSDGVLQDERIGDVSIEGKLRKLVDRARESQLAQKSN